MLSLTAFVPWHLSSFIILHYKSAFNELSRLCVAMACFQLGFPVMKGAIELGTIHSFRSRKSGNRCVTAQKQFHRFKRISRRRMSRAGDSADLTVYLPSGKRDLYAWPSAW